MSKKHKEPVQLKCVVCGTEAVVVYRGFSICAHHHFQAIIRQRKGELCKDFMTEGLETFHKQYQKVFGVKQ